MVRIVSQVDLEHAIFQLPPIRDAARVELERMKRRKRLAELRQPSPPPRRAGDLFQAALQVLLWGRLSWHVEKVGKVERIVKLGRVYLQLESGWYGKQASICWYGERFRFGPYYRKLGRRTWQGRFFDDTHSKASEHLAVALAKRLGLKDRGPVYPLPEGDWLEFAHLAAQARKREEEHANH